jgi:hypothetical protein
MNSDFTLPATSAVARRLLHIATLCKLDLDPAIVTLASQGRIAPDNPLRGVRRAAAQFMLDCDLRCAVPLVLSALDRTLILGAVHLAGSTKVTIATVNGARSRWPQVLKAAPFDSKIITLQQAFEPEHQDGRRDGVLLLDWPYSDTNHTMLVAIAREFPRTIIISEAVQHPLLIHPTYAPIDISWWNLGHCLFPDMPDGRLFFQEAFDRNITDSALWSTRHFADMAIFYNVFSPRFADLPGYNDA